MYIINIKTTTKSMYTVIYNLASSTVKRSRPSIWGVCGRSWSWPVLFSEETIVWFSWNCWETITPFLKYVYRKKRNMREGEGGETERVSEVTKVSEWERESEKAFYRDRAELFCFVFFPLVATYANIYFGQGMVIRRTCGRSWRVYLVLLSSEICKKFCRQQR